MANLPEANEYPAGVYMLETSDPVIGGYPNEQTGSGMANIPNLQLAKRTNWLKARVDQLLAQVVAATTTVAGIVRLSTSTNSTSTTMAATPSAVKAVSDAVSQRALSTRTITGAGLATGGGDLSANRTITVPIATQAQAETGTDNTTAMTPLRVRQAIGSVITITDWDDATRNGVYFGSDAANAPTNGPFVEYIGSVEIRSPGWATQTVHRFAPDGAADTMCYRRSRDNMVWGPWYRLRISEAEQAALWASITRTITGGGLATGGGDLSANRTITVPIATQAQAEAGTDNTTAMTPLRAAQAAAFALASGVVQRGSAILTEISNMSLQGMIVRTGNGTVRARTLIAGTGVTVTNGNGVADNPTVALTIASQAEAQAGAIDTKAMTPLRVKDAIGGLIGGVATAAGFVFAPGSPGYIRLPSWLGGWVVQWGYVTTTAGTASVTFPIAFPTAARSVHGTHVGAGGAMFVVASGTMSATGFTAIITSTIGGVSNTVWSGNWIAIGN